METILTAWQRIPGDINDLIAGRSDEELADLPGSEGLSVKEVVHHLAEANIVAAGMIIAALGASGSTYDWSWLWPDPAWAKRLGYDKAPVGPALEALKGLIGHISNLVCGQDDALLREVRLFDSPGAETYTLTVEQIIRHEVEHADEHLDNIRPK